MNINRMNNKKVIQSFCNSLKEQIYTPIGNLEVEGWISKEPIFFTERTTGNYIKLHVGEVWGKIWDCGWMHFQGEITEENEYSNMVAFVDVSGEGCVFDREGYPVQGITTVASEYDENLGRPAKRVIPLQNRICDGNRIDFWVEVGCNDLFGNFVDSGQLKQAEISLVNHNLRQLYYDYSFLLMLSEAQEENGTLCLQLEELLYEVANTTSITEDSIKKAIELLSNVLQQNNRDNSFHISAIGHAHIDLAWLWPIRETKRKGIRTFSTALHLMERYPDYIFGSSQPQLYQWVKEQSPYLFNEIRKRVSEGRWECQGAMWVEADTNITGGESLVRQILYGKKYFMDEFQKDMEILWLPDVFGYSAALPQLLRKSNTPYFTTIKLSWSEHNVFPYHTFRWKGIDGSEVLVHMPPEGTYNSGARPDELIITERNYKEKAISNKALVLFGIGDGGGGPGTDHLERLKREKNMIGLPSVKQEQAITFFHELQRDEKKYPKWQGELYLEKHQGTYTTQARNKKWNRRLESLLRECEFVCSMAWVHSCLGYPAEELEHIWKEVLLYQFHDILPGSSIKRVYDESIERYKKLESQVKCIIQKAYQALIPQKSEAIFNTLPWMRTEYIPYNGKWYKPSIPAYGYGLLGEEIDCTKIEKTNISDFCLENHLLKLLFDKEGNIVSLFDKEEQREVIDRSKGQNHLLVWEDSGNCWDIPSNYRERKPTKPTVLSRTDVNGEVENYLLTEYAFGTSIIKEEIRMPIDSKRVVFTYQVDWNETHKMLRAAYPIDIITNEAACDIQFGHLMRPTHNNTSWDSAKFEVCAHKFIDLSENGFGVALINDCKYGYSIKDNILDINLLRSPMYPGIDADKGAHQFSYELLIHEGNLLKVKEEAYRFNTPIQVVDYGEGRHSLQSFVEISTDNIIIEAMKLAEDKKGVIVRLYEMTGKTTKAMIKVQKASSIQRVNLLEQAESLQVSENSMELVFKPFEIMTLRCMYDTSC